MKASLRLSAGYQPMIKFLGKRTPPAKVDHTPHAHPAAPSQSLPESFASYRQQAQQHGPLGQGQRRDASTSSGVGWIGAHSGHSLGPVKPAKGEFFDRNELPARFRRTTWSAAEIEAIESGGASLYA